MALNLGKVGIGPVAAPFSSLPISQATKNAAVDMQTLSHTMYKDQIMRMPSSKLTLAICIGGVSTRALAHCSCLTELSHVDHGTRRGADSKLCCEGFFSSGRPFQQSCFPRTIEAVRKYSRPGTDSLLRAVKPMNQPYGRLLLLVYHEFTSLVLTCLTCSYSWR